MFNLQQLNIIKQALEITAKANTRAKNNAKSPEFIVIYDKIGLDLSEVDRIVTTELVKQNKQK